MAKKVLVVDDEKVNCKRNTFQSAAGWHGGRLRI